LAEESEHLDMVVILSSSLKKIKKASIPGLIEPKEQRRQTAIIEDGLIDLIKELKDADLKPDMGDLEKDIKMLGLKNLSKCALVDCDRRPPLTDFRTAFKRNRKLPYQFYFITGCPTQQPNSFAERIIYDMLDDSLDSDDSPIHYEQEPFVVDNRTIQRVRVTRLPYNDLYDLSDNQCRFRKYFAARLQHFNQVPISLEDMIANPSERLQYRFFTFVFKIDVEEWDWTPELAEYIDWLIETFKSNRSTPPTFQFLFVLDIARAHLKKRPHVEMGIKALLSKHNNEEFSPCVRIEKLDPVSVDDLKHWFRKRTNDRFLSQIDKLVSNFTRNLQQQKRWDGNGGLDMADIEQFLLDIYKASHV